MPVDATLNRIFTEVAEITGVDRDEVVEIYFRLFTDLKALMLCRYYPKILLPFFGKFTPKVFKLQEVRSARFHNADPSYEIYSEPIKRLVKERTNGNIRRASRKKRTNDD